MASVLQDFTKRREFLVCMDSDGCVMDTVRTKHSTVMCPELIRVFALEEQADFIRSAWDEINLHTITRGISRFESVVLVFDRLKNRGIELPGSSTCDIYVASIGDAASLKAAQICSDLRAEGVSAQFDVAGRSVKAQMKFADKLGAKYTCVIGDDDIAKGEVTVKDMESGEKSVLTMDDFADEFSSVLVQSAAHALADSLEDENFSGLDINTLMGGLK